VQLQQQTVGREAPQGRGGWLSMLRKW
jgi:hypothetical protein